MPKFQAHTLYPRAPAMVRVRWEHTMWDFCLMAGCEEAIICTTTNHRTCSMATTLNKMPIKY